MAMDSTDWTIDRATGNIRYTGDDHTLSGGTPTYATVIQFHRWLQLFADDEAFTGDDELDIIDQNPSDRSTDNIITLVNGFNVTATEIEHLYDGTIIQGSNKTRQRWDGIVNFGNADVHIQVMQDGAVLADDFWNYGHEAGSETGGGSATVMTDSTLGATVDEFIGYTIINVTDGSRGIILSNTATTVTVAELYGGTLDVWTTADVHHIAVPLNPDATQGISHRFMVQTTNDGVDIDRRRLVGTNRRYGNTFGEFKINGTAQGNNVFALTDTGDLNNTTSWATIDALADITNTEGLRLIDIDNDTVNEEYYSEWTRGANTINIFYEYMKMSSADATAETLNSLSGELFRGITHHYEYDNETGTNAVTNDVFCYGTNIVFTGGSGSAVLGEAVYEDTATPVWKGRIVGIDDNTGTGSIVVDIESGSVTDTETFTADGGFAGTVSGTPAGADVQVAAGRCIFYAVDDDGTSGNMYVQVLAGVAPVNNARMFFGNATADVARFHDVDTTTAAVIERTISTPFVGASTGTALIGSYGLGMEAGDTGSSDRFFDLSNTQITPPNTVTFTLSGLESGMRVLCTNDLATDIDFAQMTTNAAYTTTGITTISVNAIPIDCPSSGTIRIERDDGLYSRHPFSARDLGADDFTITSHNFDTNNAASGNNVFISYIDLSTVLTSETFQYVYDSDRTHFVRVRDADGTPMKTAETTGVMGTNGGSASISRIDDA